MKYLIHKILTKHTVFLGWACVVLMWALAFDFVAWKSLSVILALSPDSVNEPSGAFFRAGAAAGILLICCVAFPVDYLMMRAKRFVQRNGWGDNKPNYKRWVKVSLTTAIVLAVIFALTGCKKEEEVSKKVGNFQVYTLFTHDGCTVYRFYDDRAVYYTNCQGTTQYEHSYPNGKTTSVDRYETQTVVR